MQHCLACVRRVGWFWLRTVRVNTTGLVGRQDGAHVLDAVVTTALELVFLHARVCNCCCCPGHLCAVKRFHARCAARHLALSPCSCLHIWSLKDLLGFVPDWPAIELQHAARMRG